MTFRGDREDRLRAGQQGQQRRKETNVPRERKVPYQRILPKDFTKGFNVTSRHDTERETQVFIIVMAQAYEGTEEVAFEVPRALPGAAKMSDAQFPCFDCGCSDSPNRWLSLNQHSQPSKWFLPGAGKQP